MTDQATTGRIAIHGNGEGDALWMLGGLYEVRLSGAETGGAVTMIEFTVPEGMGPPPHMHDVDETVYILEGTAKYHANGTTTDVGPGSVLFIPRGAQETFEPTTNLRMLGVYSPAGGMEKFFAEAGERAQRREVPPPPTGPPDVERLVAIGSRHGLTLVAPPGH